MSLDETETLLKQRIRQQVDEFHERFSILYNEAVTYRKKTARIKTLSRDEIKETMEMYNIPLLGESFCISYDESKRVFWIALLEHSREPEPRVLCAGVSPDIVLDLLVTVGQAQAYETMEAYYRERRGRHS